MTIPIARNDCTIEELHRLAIGVHVQGRSAIAAISCACDGSGRRLPK